MELYAVMIEKEGTQPYIHAIFDNKDDAQNESFKLQLSKKFCNDYIYIETYEDVKSDSIVKPTDHIYVCANGTVKYSSIIKKYSLWISDLEEDIFTAYENEYFNTNSWNDYAQLDLKSIDDSYVELHNNQAEVQCFVYIKDCKNIHEVHKRIQTRVNRIINDYFNNNFPSVKYSEEFAEHLINTLFQLKKAI